MASNTKKTKLRRQMRDAKKGKRRKAKARALGTTPSFPIHLS